jgi:hypothetical protein
MEDGSVNTFSQKRIEVLIGILLGEEQRKKREKTVFPDEEKYCWICIRTNTETMLNWFKYGKMSTECALSRTNVVSQRNIAL